MTQQNTNQNSKHIVAVYKALSDETRFEIVKTVASTGNCCTCDCSKNLDLTQPTLSHHLKILVDAQVLLSHKQGTSKTYSVNCDYLTQLGITIPLL